MQETRQFRMHPKLLFDVISRQAGTIGKAMLEGVMNSADAGATSCEITLNATRLSIKDNGKGFRSRKEIEQWFEQFGTPHEESEGKVYGTFRMGRGQIFAFGVNEWASSSFRMKVDIKGKGLDYDLDCNASQVTGCQIDVLLYKPMLPSELAEAVREIEKMAKYVPLTLTVNGKRISIDPASEKWDEITNDAYIRLKETTSLSVYNLGVLVKDFGNWQYGCGGVVVSKNQLTLNFARNEILVAECPVWRRIKKLVDKRATDKNKRKPILDDGERQRLADQVVAGEIDAKDAKKLKLLTDVSGKHWSMDQITRCRQGGIVSSAPKGDLLGDKLMQAGTCFVFAEETLERFGKTLPQLVKFIASYGGEWWKPKNKSFGELTKGMDAKHVVLDQSKLLPREQAFVDLLRSGQDHILFGFRADGCQTWQSQNKALDRRRDILVGQSDSALAWTDGSTYVVFARNFLRGLDFDVHGLVRLFSVCLHEYCHGEADNNSHVHSQEFYQLYHDAIWAVARAAHNAMPFVPAALERAGVNLNKQVLKMQDDAEKIRRATERNLKAITLDDTTGGVAALVEPKPVKPPVSRPPMIPPTKPVSGDNPYRATSNYGILFSLGNQRFWKREDLLAEAAKAVGKEAKLVANDLAVLMNSGHASNKGRSKAVKDGEGNVKLERA